MADSGPDGTQTTLTINQKSHYHIVLFVNNDTSNGLGSYKADGTGLASLIREA
ncbi:inovirus Gp2 family protein [Escherichia coli]|nr:inovirus Gp2 family protein [Escherichia coli]